MSDVTFMRGYGFPKGGSMDYAGYGGRSTAGFAGLIVDARRKARGYAAPPNIPEPSVYAKIPAMDGFGNYGRSPIIIERMRGYGSMPHVVRPVSRNAERFRGFRGFGTAFTFTQEDRGLGDMTLPTLDTTSGEWEETAPGTSPDSLSTATDSLSQSAGLSGGNKVAVALGAVALAWLLWR